MFTASLPGGLALDDDVRNLWLYNLVYLGATICVLARAWIDPATRAAWLAVATALVLTAGANVYYSEILAEMDPTPYPSWADAGYLAAYPALNVGLVWLMKARARQWHPSVWLDGLMVAMPLGACGAAFLLAPVLEVTGADVAVVATNLAYPLCDLLLMSTVLAAVLVMARGIDLSWALFGAGVLAWGFGDCVYLIRDSAGAYVQGQALDITWLIGAILFAAASRTTRSRPGSPLGHAPSSEVRASRSAGSTAYPSRWALLATPAAVSITCIGLVVPLPGWQAPIVAQWLAGAGLLVVGARVSLTYRELWQLSDVRRQAVTDELTGLTNRRGFIATVEDLLSGRAERSRRDPLSLEADSPELRLALLLLDLDKFKEVNDSLGHHAGDELLHHVAERLTTALRNPEDVLARLGGDEFAVLMPNADVAGAEAVAARIATSLREPFVLDGVGVQVAVSIGIAVFPENGVSLSTLMRRADIAMYRAKATRSGHAVYDPQHHDADGEHRLHRLAEIRAAVHSGEMIVYYQPKVELATGSVVGAEALVRWQHPTRGLLFPDAFLDLAEEAGLMPAITSIVLDEALAQAAVWRRAGRPLVVAVNLPSAAVVDTALPKRVADLLLRHHVPAVLLKLEITEDSLLGDRVRAREVLANLRALGVQVAIDDYGSGYSSLAYLRELPVDELKLDRSFVRPMVDDERAAAIVRSTVELAHSLGLRIVAEGVEQEAAAAELTLYGCDTAQGYLYSRALPPEDFEAWLDRHDAPFQTSPRARARTGVPAPRTPTEVGHPVPDISRIGEPD